jgi:hypothetical protein
MTRDEATNLGEMLRRMLLIDDAAIALAVEAQAAAPPGTRFGQILVERGVLTDEQLTQALALQVGIRTKATAADAAQTLLRSAVAGIAATVDAMAAR